MLVSSDSLTADDQTKYDKLMIAKLPLFYKFGNQKDGILLLQVSQEPGTWKNTMLLCSRLIVYIKST